MKLKHFIYIISIFLFSCNESPAQHPSRQSQETYPKHSILDHIEKSPAILVEEKFLSMNDKRKKFGLIPISSNWKQAPSMVSMTHMSNTIFLDENNVPVKHIRITAGGLTGLYYYESDVKNKKYHGKSMIYQNEKVNKIVTYENGKIHGQTLYLDENEATKYSVEYKLNLPWDGTFVSHWGYNLPSYYLGSYKEGIKHGRSASYQNNHLKNEEFFEKGKLVKEKSYHQGSYAGLLSKEVIYLENGFVTRKGWHKNEKLAGTSHYGPTKKRHGLQQSWDETGKLIFEENYINGELHGKVFKIGNKGEDYITWYWNGDNVRTEEKFEKIKSTTPTPKVDWETTLNILEEEEKRNTKLESEIYQQKNLIANLEETIFSEKHDHDLFRSTLEAIDRSKDISLLEPLNEFYKKFEDQVLFEYDSKMHPVTNTKIPAILRQIRQVRWNLELEKMKFQSDEKKIDFLLKRIENKIVEEIDYVDAEFESIRLFAKTLKSEAIDWIDNKDHPYLKLLGLLLLEVGEDEELESIILERIDSYKEKSPVYFWMVQLLGSIGKEKGVAYLFNQISDKNKFIRSAIILNLKKLQRTNNEFVSAKITTNSELEEALKERVRIRKKEVEANPTTAKFRYEIALGSGMIIRSYEVGPYLGNKPTDDLIKLLETDKNKHYSSDEGTLQIKAAQILGDRHINGKLLLNENQKKRLEKIVTSFITNSDYMKNAGARKQMERLWSISIPTLLANVNTSNVESMDFIYKNLTKLRSKELVEKILLQAENCSENGSCENYVILFRYLKNGTQVTNPRRKIKDKNSYEKFYGDAIEDFVSKHKKQ